MPRKLASHSRNSKKYDRCIPDATLDEIQILDGAFNNRQSYNRQCDEWMIPDVLFTKPHWEDMELQEMKRELNAVKGKLDNIKIERWQEHTQNTNRAACIRNYIRSDFSPELSTQAWFKFHEILGRFPELVRPDGERLNSVHLCEAPGAFIASLQHFLLSRGKHEHLMWSSDDYSTVHSFIPDISIAPLQVQCYSEAMFPLTRAHTGKEMSTHKKTWSAHNLSFKKCVCT